MSEDSHSSIPLHIKSQESVVLYSAQPAGEGSRPANESDVAAVKGEFRVNTVTLYKMGQICSSESSFPPLQLCS